MCDRPVASVDVGGVLQQQLGTVEDVLVCGLVERRALPLVASANVGGVRQQQLGTVEPVVVASGRVDVHSSESL